MVRPRTLPLAFPFSLGARAATFRNAATSYADRRGCLIGAADDVGAARLFGGGAYGDRARDVVGQSKRDRGPAPVRFAPRVRDDAPAFAAFSQTIFNAITVCGRNDESVSLSGLR